MLTYAIGFIQSTQLISFAIIFLLMAFKDRENRSLRWLAFGYLSGVLGGLLQLGHHLVPAWASLGLFLEAAPIGYACVHAGIVCFVGRGSRTRWISVFLIAATLPLYLLWANPAQIIRSETVADLVLAVQTSLTAGLLLTTRDSETLWPRRIIAAFLSLYAAVGYARVAVFFFTGKTPDLAAPWVEVASGMVYVVACSVLPLAVIWMFHERLHAHMDRQTTSDSLTQLLNRRGIQAIAEHELARYLRGRQNFTIVLIDIDHFKRLNDTFGHAGGDIVLRDTAALFKRLLRDTDSIGRLGGEEFVLLLPNTPPEGAAVLIERLRLTLQIHTFQLGDKQTRITCSFGITASHSRDTLTWEMLLQEADIALYTAKRTGRNRAELYPCDASRSEIFQTV
jgi:diguanylate cyclase (GGDEF)-like protein